MQALSVKVFLEHCVILQHFVEALIVQKKKVRADSLMNSHCVSLWFDEDEAVF